MSARFVIISDTHFFAPGRAPADKLYWNRVLQSQAPGIARCLVDTINALAPDFVIHCGDFTGLCDMENYAFGCQLMDQLTCPWYAVLGNHDTWYPGIRDAFAARYGLPRGQCYYRRDLAGLRFLFLDVAYWTSAQGEVSPYLDKDLYDSGQILGMGPTEAELLWLQAELGNCPGRPVVLVSHAPLGFKDAYPLSTLPKGGPVQAGTTSLADTMGDVLLRRELREIIGRYENVRLALAGHWHINDATHDAGVTFCQTSSLREYPFEMRLVRLQGSELSVSTVGLDDPSFRQLSYVAEWGNEWVGGRPADREFAVDLA